MIKLILSLIRLLFVYLACLLLLGITACNSKSPKNNLSPAEQKFFELCANGTPEQIEEAIKRDKIDVNKTTTNGEDSGVTPLIIAAANNKDNRVI